MTVSRQDKMLMNNYDGNLNLNDKKGFLRIKAMGRGRLRKMLFAPRLLQGW
jgi:hypothetical protein